MSAPDFHSPFRWPQDLGWVRNVYPDLRSFQETHPEVDMYACGGLLSLSQYRYLYSLVDAYVSKEADILDWGCGHGHFSHYLLSSGYRRVSSFSLDSKPVLLTEAERRFSGCLRHSTGSKEDAVRLPYASGEFDAAFSVGVLEHVRETGGDERKSMREIYRILRPGGLFIVFHFPNRSSWIESLARKVTSQYTHPYRFTMSEVRALCLDTGFRLERTHTYAFLPRNLFRFLPDGVRDSVRLAGLFNRPDAALERMLPRFCQNHLFVARRPWERRIA